MSFNIWLIKSFINIINILLTKLGLLEDVQ